MKHGWIAEGDHVVARDADGQLLNDGRSIAVCHGDNADEHARLIAAAPELLEACKEFVRKVENGEARSTRSYAEMKAAIAKAVS